MKKMMPRKPIVGITMGDAAGIGPEIVTKTLSEKEVFQFSSPLVIGDAGVMEKALAVAKANIKVHKVRTVPEGKFTYGTMDILDMNNINVGRLKMGMVDKMCGKAAVTYVKKAGELAMAGTIDATTSAPVNKEAMRAAGYSYEGQTQILGELTGTKDYAMMLVMGKIRLFLVTTHLALRDACDRVTEERVYSVINLANEAMLRLGIKKPRIGVSGLNPHAGEGGLFGKEEIKQIIPAIESARRLGINAIGPIPPDIVFIQARDGKYDVVLSMYHDHGTMATKLLGFGTIVTVLVGLPIIRTSVGHGTAFDIAGKGIANHQNLLEAVRVASQMARVRMERRNRKPGGLNG